MNLFVNGFINSYSILLLVIILVHSFQKSDNESINYKLYNAMLIVTIMMLVFDIFGRFDGRVDTYYSWLNQVGNFMIFFLHQILPSLWFLYVYYQINHSVKKLKTACIPLLIINGINAFLVTISQFTGWYYVIDAANVYHRGPFYNISAIFTLMMLFGTAAYIFMHRKKFEKKYYFSLMFFCLPPFIGMVLQVYVFNFALALSGVAVSLLIVFLNIQNKTIFTDYLTKIGNRIKLQSVLNEKISTSTKDRTFSLIMVDLDDFKNINDTYGHGVGDETLINTAKLLAECVRARDYIFRFGGDEFCVIVDIFDRVNLENTVERICDQVKLFNDSHDISHKIYLSMGYAVYDYSLQLDADAFMCYVDALMYQQKQEKTKAKEISGL